MELELGHVLCRVSTTKLIIFLNFLKKPKGFMLALDLDVYTLVLIEFNRKALKDVHVFHMAGAFSRCLQ